MIPLLGRGLLFACVARAFLPRLGAFHKGALVVVSVAERTFCRIILYLTPALPPSTNVARAIPSPTVSGPVDVQAQRWGSEHGRRVGHAGSRLSLTTTTKTLQCSSAGFASGKMDSGKSATMACIRGLPPLTLTLSYGAYCRLKLRAGLSAALANAR